MNRVAVCLLWTLLLGCVFGCKAKVFRAETELSADGSVRRAIYQPTAETPAVVRDGSLWQGTTYAVSISEDRWRGDIADLPAAASDKDHQYFAAWGQFSAVSQLPQSLLIDAPEGVADGTLERDYEPTDYVFVTEHRWRETLTNVVTLDDMHQARQELAEIVLPLAEQTLQRAYGESHDIQPLVDWTHQEGRSLFNELTDMYFDLASRKKHIDEATLVTTIEPILRRRGFSTRDASGAMDDLDEVAPKFIRQLITEKLRQRDGSPAADETVSEIMQWLGAEPRPETDQPSRLDVISKEVIVAKFTSEEAFTTALQPLAARILGIYFNIGPGRHFHYQHKMPGLLVETSGELLSDSETLWRFTDAQAYPFGYTMECRSLEPNVALEQKLLGKSVLTDRKAMLRYVELVHENEPLLAILRRCEADGDLRPLRNEYKVLSDAGAESATAFGQLLSLLEGQ